MKTTHATLAAVFVAAATCLAETKPNLIVIYTDDHGWPDIGAQAIYPDLKTPNIDALAKSGARAVSGYSTAPQCVPSRAGLLSGRYQNRFGIESNGGELAGFNAQPTIAERLKPAGYATGMAGKWHLGPDAQIPTHGFDHSFPMNNNAPTTANITSDGEDQPMGTCKTPLYHIDACAQVASAFIKRYQSQPFFFYLAFRAPHVPLDPPQSYLDRFPGEMPERRRYALAMMSAIDDGVGRIMAKLKEHGLDRDTLVFFTSDNGAPLKGKKDLPIDKPGGAWDGSLNDPLNGEKGTLLEGGIRVPFVVSWPNGLPAGRVYNRPVSSLDITATAMQVAGLDADKAVDGVNLLPHLRGEASGDPHAALFWRFWGQTAVRAGDWKLVRLDNGATEMLYHLGEDLGEKSNRLDAEPKKVAELRALLAKWESQMMPTKPRGGLNVQEKEWFSDQLRKETTTPPAKP